MSVKQIILLILFQFNAFDCKGIVGKYRTKLLNVTTCPSNPDKIDARLTWSTKSVGAILVDSVNVQYNITALIGPVGAEIEIMKWNNITKTFESISALGTNKICSWFFLASEVTSLPRVDTKCNFVKGPVNFTVPDTNRISHKILGNTVPYGNYKSIIKFRAKRNVFMCRIFYSDIGPI